jgi:molybdopterin converting factor small subunit
MGVTVELLASPLRALVDSRAQLTLSFVPGETLGAFLDRRFTAYPGLRRETTGEDGGLRFEYQVWHAEEMVRGDGFRRVLRDGDTVAFLLPISGGSRAARGGRRPATIRSA